MRPVDHSYRLAGEVISQVSGEPVVGALVSAWPREAADSLEDRRQLWPAYDVRRTDSKGRFSLAAPQDDDVCLLVRHGDLVQGPRVIVSQGMSWVRLVVVSAVRVIVGRKSLVNEPASWGPIRCLLVDRHRKRTIAWDGRPAFGVPGVPRGSYNVFLASAEGGYGQACVDVSQGEEALIVVGTVPGTWFEGSVVNELGDPLVGASVRMAYKAPRLAGRGVQVGCYRHYGLRGSFSLVRWHITHGSVGS